MLKTNPLTTAAQCLAAVAQHYGVALAADNLSKDYIIGNHEPSSELLIRIASANGLDAYYRALDWNTLLSLEGVFPVIAQLNNGNYVIIAGIHKENNPIRVAILDPLELHQNVLSLEATQFCARWKGDAVFVKRPPAAVEPRYMTQQEIEALTNEVNLFLAWKNAGYASPPPDFIKKEVVLRYLAKLKPGETIFIEAGIAIGSTAKLVSERGYRVIVIEQFENLHTFSRALLEPIGVTCLKGDCATVLPQVLKSLPHGMSVFLLLDGTTNGELPIAQELLAIDTLLARSETPLIVQLGRIPGSGSADGISPLDQLVDYCRDHQLYWNMVFDSFFFSNRKFL